MLMTGLCNALCSVNITVQRSAIIFIISFNYAELVYGRNEDIVQTVAIVLLGGARRVAGSQTLGGSTVKPSVYSSKPAIKSCLVFAL